jgi:16S rRNA (guanine(966)-N(2))-methyltransferase RsmD
MAVLDLFAGVGTLGLEALSRGAISVTFVDHFHQSLAFLKKNVSFCPGCKERVKLFPTDFRAALKALSHKKCAFDLIFIDPPYERDFVAASLKLLDNSLLLKESGTIIVQHSCHELIPDDLKQLSVVDTRKYGDTVISFCRSRTHLQ